MDQVLGSPHPRGARHAVGSALHWSRHCAPTYRSVDRCLTPSAIMRDGTPTVADERVVGIFHVLVHLAQPSTCVDVAKSLNKGD